MALRRLNVCVSFSWKMKYSTHSDPLVSPNFNFYLRWFSIVVELMQLGHKIKRTASPDDEERFAGQKTNRRRKECHTCRLR